MDNNKINLSKVWSGKIESEKDVRDFFHYLIIECKLNFHPDDSFLDFQNQVILDGVMTHDICLAFDFVMKECFLFCEEHMVIKDIYSIGMEVMNVYLSSTNVIEAKAEIIQKFEDFKISLQSFQSNFGHKSWNGYIDGVVEGYLGYIDLTQDLDMVMKERLLINCDECGNDIWEDDIEIDATGRTVCKECMQVFRARK
jgi:hypothetical protein